MRAPAFWNLPAPDWRAQALRPLAALYAHAAARRFARAPRGSAPVPVVCVGNPTVGGAGKTPTAIHIAGTLAGVGRRPVFLSRGYGARIAAPLLVDCERHSAVEAGDEPLLLCRHAPTVVAPDRLDGARFAASHGDVIVMDDGFQNPALAKDLSILVVDGEAGLGNGLCLPAGPLRLPLAPQIERCQALLLIGGGARGETAARAAERAGKHVLRARLIPDPSVGAGLFERRVVAFAGIGRPEKFFATLESLGADVLARRAFADHHTYGQDDAAELLALADARHAMLVTTEKDMARLRGASGEAGRLAAAAAAVPVVLSLDPASSARLDELVANMLDAG